MFDYKIHEHIALLSESGEASKRLSVISWNGAAPKIDIRGWKIAEDGVKPLKGISLSQSEALALRDALVEYFGAS